MKPGCIAAGGLRDALEKGAGEPEAMAGFDCRGPGGDLGLPLAAKPEADIVRVPRSREHRRRNRLPRAPWSLGSKRRHVNPPCGV